MSTNKHIACTVAVVIASCIFLGQAASEPKQPEIDSADRLFQLGKFADAGKLYAQIAAQQPNYYSATLRLGRIALLSNRLDDAQRWLEKAISLRPNDTDAKVMLAEAFYRRDDFQRAAASLNGVDVSSNKLIIEQYPTLNVAMLESFKGQTPYELQGNGTMLRNSPQCKAPFRAGSTLRFGLGGLSHSPSAIGPSKMCPPQCFHCANFRKDSA